MGGICNLCLSRLSLECKIVVKAALSILVTSILHCFGRVLTSSSLTAKNLGVPASQNFQCLGTLDFGAKSWEKFRAIEVCFVATNKLNQAKGTSPENVTEG